MGLANSFMSLGRIAGPIWAGSLYDIDVSYPYLSGAAILFSGFMIAALRSSKFQRSVTEPVLDPSSASD